MLKSKNKRKSRGVINLLGQTFGYLTVIEYVGLNKHNKSTWLCLCMCGNKIETSGNDLRRGHTKSCSCLQKEKASNRITHGLSRNRYLTGYSCWANIKSRCRNKKSISYKNYGAIGVKMCDRWYYSFDNFINDMGERPSMIHSVDRYPNKKGNYEPGNCRWATPDEQARNTKSNVSSISCMVVESSGPSSGCHRINSLFIGWWFIVFVIIINIFKWSSILIHMLLYK